MAAWRLLYAETGARGSFELHTPGPKLVVSVAKGHLEECHILPYMQRVNELIARDGSVTILHDWYEMTGYDTRVRVDWTRWSQERVKQIESTHILVRSRVVAMGVRTAALALSLVGARLSSYTERDQFEALLARHGVREPLRACS